MRNGTAASRGRPKVRLDFGKEGTIVSTTGPAAEFIGPDARTLQVSLCVARSP